MKNILSQYHLENIDQNSIIKKKFIKGETITREGDSFNYIYLVISGKAKVCRYGANGRDSILAYYMEKGIFGDIELALDKNYYETTCIATIDCHCLKISKNIIKEQFNNNINFSKILNKILAEKLVNRANGFSDSAIKDASARLCDYILAHSENNIFKDKLGDVASSIGISYRHLSRLLKKLCDDNILKKQKNNYQIINLAKLSENSV